MIKKQQSLILVKIGGHLVTFVVWKIFVFCIVIRHDYEVDLIIFVITDIVLSDLIFMFNKRTQRPRGEGQASFWQHQGIADNSRLTPG